jgi:hypothetical protein
MTTKRTGAYPSGKFFNFLFLELTLRQLAAVGNLDLHASAAGV